MGIKTKTITKVPFWSRMYLTYGEEAAPEDADDRKLVDDFKDELEREGLRLICPIDGTYSEFEPYPKFGLACDTEDWTAEVLPKTYEIELNETLFAKFSIEAHSRKEAVEKALEHIKGGYEPWQSKGMKVKRCKEVPREEVAG